MIDPNCGKCYTYLLISNILYTDHKKEHSSSKVAITWINKQQKPELYALRPEEVSYEEMILNNNYEEVI